MANALLLVDIHNDYFSGGAIELVGIQEAAANTARVLHAFRAASRPVFQVQRRSLRAEAGFFIPGNEDEAHCQ